MAHTSSTRKRIRQDRKRQVRNQATKTHIKTLTKKFRAADAESAPAALKEITRALGKAATKGVIKQQTASRRIGRLTKAASRKAAEAAAS
jgi:small subunit ribosomal protein S20